MLPLFTKPLEDVSVEDINALFKEEYPEDGTVEFKENIPSKAGTDSWQNGGDIGKRGRNKILAEVIAFANAYGGTLILGIKETESHPHRAEKIVSIPRCAELAERLRLQIRDCVDPQIPIIHVRGIPAGEDDSGVVIIRVPQSRMAPHRLNAKDSNKDSNKECYFRHTNRTQTMTMREIQDLTLQRERGAERLDKLFADRHTKFQSWIKNAAKQSRAAVACRVTLIPTSDLYAEEVYQKPELFASQQKCTIKFDNGSEFEAFLPRTAIAERPIVRGTRRVDDIEESLCYQELHCSGLVEVFFGRIPKKQDERQLLYQAWILGAACNGLVMADTFRKGVGAPDVEYAFEVEIGSTMSDIPIVVGTHYGFKDPLGTSPPNPCLYPRMSLDNSEEFPRLIKIIWRDIWNSCGEPFEMNVTSLSFKR